MTGTVFPYLNKFSNLKEKSAIFYPKVVMTDFVNMRELGNVIIFYPIVVMTDNVNMRELGNVHRSPTLDPSYPLCMNSTVTF